jgi:hypothetical protein
MRCSFVSRLLVGFILLTSLASASSGASLEAAGEATNTDARAVRHAETVSSEYIVGLAPVVLPEETEAIATKLGREYSVDILYVYRNAFHGFHCRGASAALQRLASDSRVDWVEKNAIMQSSSGSTQTVPFESQDPVAPADPPYFGGWTLRRLSERVRSQNCSSPSDCRRYGYATGGDGVRAYIVDSGVLATHRDFAGRVVSGFNALTGLPSSDTETNPCPNDSCYADADGYCPNAGHGTAVASMLGGSRYGVAPGVTIVPVRVMNCGGQALVSDLVKGLDWIAGDLVIQGRSGMKGAVINISSEASLSIIPTDDEATVNQPALKAALRGVIQAGGVVFAAAGNNIKNKAGIASNGDSCLVSPAKFAYNSGGPGPHVITTSGLTEADQRWKCSTDCSGDTQFSFGQCVDFFAPARFVKAAGIKFPGRTPEQAERAVGRSGTSFASPQTAGIAARLLSELNLYNRFFPARTSDLVWNVLRESATIGEVALDPNDATVNRMVYAGGVTIKTQPRILRYVGDQAELYVDVVGRGTSLTYQWFKGSYRAASQVRFATPPCNPAGGQLCDFDRFLVPLGEAAQYWVRISETPTNTSSPEEILVTDSAIVNVSLCPTPPVTQPPSVDMTPVTGGLRLSVNLAGSGYQYKWYSGPPTDATLVATTTVYETTVAPDVSTPYWVRIITGSSCTIDSAVVMAEAVCKVPTEIMVGAQTAVVKVLGQSDSVKTQIVRLTETETSAPILTVARGGSVALTMRVAGGHVACSQWNANHNVDLCLGEQKLTYYVTNITQPVTFRASVKVQGCETPTTRFVKIEPVPSDRLIRGIESTAIDVPACPDPAREGVKIPCNRVPLTVFHDSTAQLIEWRFGSQDDRDPVIDPNTIQRVDPVGAMPSGTRYNAWPGQYWVRFAKAPSPFSSVTQTIVEDSAPIIVRCPQCTITTGRPLKVEGMIKVKKTGTSGPPIATTYYEKQGLSEALTLEVPQQGAGTTYEWRAGDYDDSKPILGTSATLDTSAIGLIWVRTKLPNGSSSESHPLTITVAPITPHIELVVGPESRAIALERNATIDAHLVGCDSEASFAWYSRDPQGLTAAELEDAQVDEGARHVVNSPTDDVTLWVKATTDPACPGGDPPAASVTITVLCEPVAHVSIVSNPLDPHLAQDDLIALSAYGYGKRLVYTWFRGPENNEAVSTLTAHGPGLLRQPTSDSTYWVRTEDGCGNVDTDAITLYVCKPSVAPLPETVIVTAGSGKDIIADVITPAGAQDPEYQWYAGDRILGGTPISGATSRTFTAMQAGSYYVTVKGMCADGYRPVVNSTAVRVVICNPPVITGISSREIAPGQTGVISVTATGSNLTYQWYRGSQLLEGETSLTLVASPGVTTTYWCRVTSDGNCFTDSPLGTIDVCSPPSIASTVANPPKIRPGGTTTLSVSASGALSYQWLLAADNSPIVGATAATFTTPVLSEDTSYRVRALNGECKTDGSVVTVTVCNINVLLTSDKIQVVDNESATLIAAVTNARSPEIFYSWYVGASGTTTQLVTEGPGTAGLMVSPSTATWYWVRVSDGTCTIDSTAIRVDVCHSPKVTTHPQPQLLDKTQNPSASATIQVAATGDNLTYQWYIGEKGVTTNPIGGATASSLSVSPDQTTTYWARVSGSCGVPADTDAATVTVCVPAAISGQPVSKIAGANVPTQLDVTATGTDLSYAWYRGVVGDTTNPVGGNSSSLPVSVPVTTQYWVRVIGACGSVNSAAAFVSVMPAIATQPVDTNTTMNTSATFTVAASGTLLSYQWFQSPANTAISGATGVSYTTPALSANAFYYVQVTSGTASITSNVAEAIICLPKSVNVSQPSTQAGTSVTLSIVSPDGNQSYSWYQGVVGNTSVPLGAATARMVNPDATTSYWVRNSGYGCTSDSAQITVTVCAPRIATHPAPAAVTAGQNATMSVAAAGPGPFTYQWFAGASGVTSSPVNGQTTATMSITATSTQTYWARVTGSCGTADSNAAQVTVCQPPAVTVQPVTKDATANVPTQIEVQATGTGLNYAWFRGTVGTTSDPIGANSNVLTVTPVDTRQYWARITGSCGTVNSAGAWINVAPVITTQPVSMNVTSGMTATFSVAASGTFVDYQWFQSPANTPISGATGTSYTTPALTSSASYYVRVRSGSPSVNSNVVTATVCQAKGVTISQASTQAGTPVTLSIVSPDGNQSYSWYQGVVGNTSVPLGAATARMVYPDVTTSYWVRNSGYGCTSDSAQITVTVCAPRIVTHPAPAAATAGQNASMSVAAAGPGPFTYQWYAGASGVTSSPVNGQTTATMSITASSTQTYWARVTGSCGSVDSNAAQLTVCQPPAITQQPQSVTATANVPKQVSVTATGTNLAYQWYEGAAGVTTNPVGTNSAVLDVTTSVTRQYWVRVSNSCGSVNSVGAWVMVAPVITTQPVSTNVTSGTTATFTVVAGGTQLAYQWYQAPATPISGATGPSYTTPALTSNASYFVRIWSGSPSVDSNTVTATVCVAKAVYVSQPSTVAGSGVALYIVSPDGNQTYTWYQGPVGNTSTQIGTGTALMVYPTQSTNYWVRNSGYGCTSNSAAVTVNVCYPRIDTQPVSALINSGQAATLTVAAVGTPALTYQWYLGATGNTSLPISGATGTSMTVTPSSTTNYWVQVRSLSAGGGCVANSNTAEVRVCVPPAITSQPPNTIIYSTDTVTLTVGATGDELTYQWFEVVPGNNIALGGQTSNTLVIQPNTTRSFWVRVTGRCGVVDSAVAKQSVRPTITQHPVNTSVCAGANASFTVGATGSPDMQYRWYLGPVGSRATYLGLNPTLTIPVTSPTSVWCEVSSGDAFVPSQLATASVQPGPAVGVSKSYMGWGWNFILTASVTPEDQGNVYYAWYQGPIGNTTNLIGQSYSVMVYAEATTWYWVRVTHGTTGCWTDRAISAPY